MINESEDFAMIVHWRKKHFNSLFNRLFLKVQDEIIPFAELQVFYVKLPMKILSKAQRELFNFLPKLHYSFPEVPDFFLFFNNVSQKWFILGWCLGIWTGNHVIFGFVLTCGLVEAGWWQILRRKSLSLPEVIFQAKVKEEKENPDLPDDIISIGLVAANYRNSVLFFKESPVSDFIEW